MKTTSMILRSAVAATALMASAGPVAADGYGHDRWPPPSRLEGTWVVAINPYDCTSGQATATFIKAFHTFTGGGTMVESTAGITFQPGQRGPGLGFWERTGRHSFRSVFEGFVLFDSVDPPAGTPVYKRGTQRFDQGIEFRDADHWVSDALVTFRDTAGNRVPPSGCAHVTAERMQ